MTDITYKISQFLGNKNRFLKEQNDDIAWGDVREAAEEIAEEIYDEVDDEKINGILDKVAEMEPSDTEEAIGMVERMMRGD